MKKRETWADVEGQLEAPKPGLEHNGYTYIMLPLDPEELRDIGYMAGNKSIPTYLREILCQAGLLKI